MLDKIINIEAPVPEPDETLAAQLESAKRSDSPRIAVLYTSREKFFETYPKYIKRPKASYDNIPILTDEEKEILYDVSLPETNETLRLNKEKTKTFFKTDKLPGAEFIRNYLKENGYAALIAKAENVGTATREGMYLVARTRRGVELSLSRFTNEESFKKQWEINEQEFGAKNLRQYIEVPKSDYWNFMEIWRLRKLGFDEKDGLPKVGDKIK